MSDFASPPYCRDDPPWGVCGDRSGPDFGAVFAWPAAGRAARLTYDRQGRQHALTLLDGRALGGEIVLQGRRFTVAAGSPDEATHVA